MVQRATGRRQNEEADDRCQHGTGGACMKDDRDLKDQALLADRSAGISASSDTGRSASPKPSINAAARGSPKPASRAAAGSSPRKAAAAVQQPGPERAAADLKPTPDAAALTAAAAQPASGSAAAAAGDASNDINVSPSQQRPRGWQAMLMSPKEEPEQGSNMFASDAADKAAAPGSPSSSLQQQLLEPLSQQASDSSSKPHMDCAAAGPAPASPAAAAAAAGTWPSSSSSSSGATRAGRPSPLLVPTPSSGSGGPPSSIVGPPSSRLSQLRVSSSPQGGLMPSLGLPSSSSTGSFRSPAVPRPALMIQPPVSPLGYAGCTTPVANSPSAMARPYSGPTLCVDDLDLDVIDDIVGVDGSGISTSSSPILSAPGSAGPGSGPLRSGGLRSSRDQHDLRRAALMNHMLSPRPGAGPLSVSNAGPPSMFTGDTRTRGLPGSASSSTSSITSAAAAQGSAPGSGPAGSEGEGHQVSGPFSSTVEQLQHLLTARGSRGASPASSASPAAPSILAGTTRSQPGTPAGVFRYNMAATFANTAGSAGCASGPCASSSRSSSMTASPVPPPTHGPAAALLAGSVLASPRTPSSPLSVMFSPYSGQAVHSGTATPLPPPLFGAGGINFVPGGPEGSPSAAAAGLICSDSGPCAPPGSATAVQPGSRLHGPSPTFAAAAAAAPSGAAQQNEDEEQAAQQAELEMQQLPNPDLPNIAPIELGIVVNYELPQQPARHNWHPPQQQLQEQPQLPQPEQQHLSQLLSHRLQLHDTRLGPHGESPLSPSHHSSSMHHVRGEGSLLSPTRPTPLVPPALAAAPAQASDSTAHPAAAPAGSGDGSLMSSSTAAALAAAAAASAVGDVGRNDVHEWLDQHSWPFRYELPLSLRDAADLARSQGLSITSPVVSAAPAGPMPGGQLPSMRGILSEGQLRQLGARLERFRLDEAAAAAAAGADSRPDSFRLESLERFRTDTAASDCSSSVSGSRPGSSSRPFGAGRVEDASLGCLVGSAAGFSSRPGSGLGSSSRPDSARLCEHECEPEGSFYPQSGLGTVRPGSTRPGSRAGNVGGNCCDATSAVYRAPGGSLHGMQVHASSRAAATPPGMLPAPAILQAAVAAAAGGSGYAAMQITCDGGAPAGLNHVALSSGLSVSASGPQARTAAVAAAAAPGVQGSSSAFHSPVPRATAGPGLPGYSSSPSAAAAAAPAAAARAVTVPDMQDSLQRQDMTGPDSRRGPVSGGGSVRLLSPGSHRYTAGSPVAQDSCCCSCNPLSSQAAAPTAIGSSNSSAVELALPSETAAGQANSGGDRAAFPGSSGLHGAGHSSHRSWPTTPADCVVVDDAVLQLPPSHSSDDQLHLRSRMGGPLAPQQQQQLRQGVLAQGRQQQHSAFAAAPEGFSSHTKEGSTPGAAGCSNPPAGCSNPQQQPDDEVACLPTSGGGCTLPGQMSDQQSAAGQPGCIAADGNVGGLCSSDARHAPAASGSTTGNFGAQPAAASGSAGLGAGAGRSLPVLALLQDKPYLSRLLASLQGVNPASPAVQQAVMELQGAFATAQEQQHVREQEQ